MSAAGVKVFALSQGLPLFRTTDAAAIAPSWGKAANTNLGAGVAYVRYGMTDSWSAGDVVLNNAHSPCMCKDGNYANLHFCFNRW